MIGTGIAKGLVLTAKNLLSTYTDKERLPTIEYPDEKQPLHEATRQFPMLVFDGEDSMKGLRCTACQICEKECPPQCIYIVMERDEKGKALKRPKVFDIDISVCMSCQVCVEVCPFDAIKMDQVYEIATRDRFGGLLLHREDLSKSNAYYHEIHPAEATAVDAALAEQKAKQAAAKAAKAAAPAPKPPAAAASSGGPTTTAPLAPPAATLPSAVPPSGPATPPPTP